MLLAIDPGMNTGIAFSNGYSQTLVFKGCDDIAQAMIDFGKALRGFFNTQSIESVLIEKPFFHGHSKMMDLTHALIWEVHKQAKFRNISRYEIAANTIRKEVIGRARRKIGESVKDFDAEIKQAVQQHGFKPTNEHEADAAALICAYRKINHCEGQSLQTVAPHNGSITKGKSNDKCSHKL